MTRTILASASIAALVALSACSSDDDDDTPEMTDPTGETSMPTDLPPLSSEPGGDTSAIAGFWNAPRAVDAEESDARYVVIEENGLYTSYELQQDDIDGGNCYSPAGPQTLSPSEDVENGYDLADTTSFTATASEDGTTLTVGTEDPVTTETWTRVENIMESDLPLCSVS